MLAEVIDPDCEKEEGCFKQQGKEKIIPYLILVMNAQV